MSASITYVVKAPRMNEMAQWLGCNDVDSHQVPYDSAVFVESTSDGRWLIRFEVYRRSEHGVLRYDPVTRTYDCEERVVPLLNDPPMWWLVEAAPTGGGAASAGPASLEVAAGDDTVAEGACNCD